MMKKRVSLLLALSLLGTGSLYAQEHPACKDLDYRFETHSAQELRQIAASCSSGALATLYSYRAEHADMVAESKMFAAMASLSRTGVSHSFESYRIYIALIESFAPVYYPDADERIAFLSREYQRYGEIVELRLKGYDRLADRLERQIQIP